MSEDPATKETLELLRDMLRQPFAFELRQSFRSAQFGPIGVLYNSSVVSTVTVVIQNNISEVRPFLTRFRMRDAWACALDDVS
jgi:hypothetical protein